MDYSSGDRGGVGHYSRSYLMCDSGGSDSTSAADSEELKSFCSGAPSSGYLSDMSNSLISYADKHLQSIADIDC